MHLLRAGPTPNQFPLLWCLSLLHILIGITKVLHKTSIWCIGSTCCSFNCQCYELCFIMIIIQHINGLGLVLHYDTTVLVNYLYAWFGVVRAGISLTTEQWSSFKKNFPAIREAIEKMEGRWTEVETMYFKHIRFIMLETKEQMKHFALCCSVVHKLYWCLFWCSWISRLLVALDSIAMIDYITFRAVLGPFKVFDGIRSQNIVSYYRSK